MRATLSRNAGRHFENVRELGLKLPDVVEATAYGAPALKLRGKLLACIATNRQAEPDSLVVCVDFVSRDLLIAKDPAVYYVKPHYVPYSCVLVRLKRIKKTDLKEILNIAWRFISDKTKPRRTRQS